MLRVPKDLILINFLAKKLKLQRITKKQVYAANKQLCSEKLARKQSLFH
jgi:hypothetical protein